MQQSTVLIADDDDLIRDVYSTAFKNAGMNVLLATTGKECVELALQHHPDVILVDILMPDMNGHKAIDKLRYDDWGKHANIVYLTNLSDAENVTNAVANKTDEYIIKANTTVKEVVNKVRLSMHTSS